MDSFSPTWCLFGDSGSSVIENFEVEFWPELEEYQTISTAVNLCIQTGRLDLSLLGISRWVLERAPLGHQEPVRFA